MATQLPPVRTTHDDWAPVGPPTPNQGETQRAWLAARFNAIRGWTLLASLLGGVLATDLAVRHTNATTAAASVSGQIADAQLAATGSSLFQGQGDSGVSAGGSFLAPSPALSNGRVARTSTS